MTDSAQPTGPRNWAGLHSSAFDDTAYGSLTRWACGKPAAEAARIAGLMGDRAPAAHEAAARAALSLSIGPDADDEGLRRLAEETLSEHLARIATCWPRAMGWPEQPRRIGPTEGDLDAIALELFGSSGPPRHIGAFERWLAAEPTSAAQMLRHIWRRWDARWGRAEIALWGPDRTAVGLDWASAELDGAPFENTVAARVADDDLMRAIEARRGRGLIWRLVGRLVDAARLIEALAGRAPLEKAEIIGPGVGAAPTACGVVFVFARLNQGRVGMLERLTPADCSTQPEGLLSRMTAGRGSRRPPAEFEAMALASLDLDGALSQGRGGGSPRAH